MSAVAGRRPVAIVGMACRFPGADTPAAFWDNLCRGVESITFFSDDELLATGVAPALLRDPSYVKAAPILSDVDGFDAAFFGYSPREAAIMDPQQRLFLEVAWEAFEDAGYYPAGADGVVGVFAGGGGVVTSYLVAHGGHPAFPGQTAGLAHLGNDKDFLATRVSYKLNLTGPSLTVQTACSTSLVAVHLACRSLREGECDMALAGAATVRIPQASGYVVEKGNVHSVDGHCRAFDAAGQGTIFGSGVAAVLLKDLARALADGNHVHAVILGSAVNNDGGAKVSYTAPSVAGQARAMVQALALAGVPAETVGYVECHATGTAIGDPLEVQALTSAFRTQTERRGFCAIASVKPNIGHPEQTAGLAGLMKTALALRHARIPPSLHFVTPNPRIDFEESPFYVNTALRDFPANGHPRRAAVNSLGIGGTNAFAVLEEPPGPSVPGDAPDGARPAHLFTLSAKTEPALRDYATRFAAHLDMHPDVPVADLCYTTNVSRSHFPCRFAATTSGVADLREKLGALAAGRAGAAASHRKDRERPIAFLFTGQGAQYPGMTADLYRTEPTFRRVLDECCAMLRPQLDRALLDVLFARDDGARLVHETVYTQPALFAVEYALAELWRAWGVTPEAVMGHSVGELVAACVAGVFELPDALRLVAVRGRLMQGLARQGTMAVVFAAEAVVRPALDGHEDRVAIAAINGPGNTVISGDRDVVARVLAKLERRGIASKRLAVSHAFHSPLMEPILDALEEAAGAARAHEPGITLISNLTGAAIEGAPAARYWRDHARRAVRFADGLRTLQELGHEIYLEVGPGSTLLGMGRQCVAGAETTWLASLGASGQDWKTLQHSLARLYLEGFAINWQGVHGGARRRRLPLPTYPFQRRRYWLERTEGHETAVAAPRAPAAQPRPEAQTRPPPNEIQLDSPWGVEQRPYLGDHRMHGRLVVPTAAGLEAALAAGRACFGDGDIQVEDFTYHAALLLPEDGSRPVRVVLTPRGEDRATFRLLAGPGPDGEWRTHMTAVVSRAAGVTTGDDAAMRDFSPADTRAHCPRQIDADAFYTAARDLGLAYGPSFRGVETVWLGDRTALGRVRLPAPTLDAAGLHPAFLDASLHVYLALLGDGGQAYLPARLDRFRVYRQPVTEAWAHAALRESAAGDDGRVVDIRIYDDTDLVAVLEGLTVSRVPSGDLTDGGLGSLAEWLYELRWDKVPAPLPRAEAPPGSWLILADRGGVGDRLAALLEQRGNRCHIAKAGVAARRTGARTWAIDPAQPADAIHRLVHETAASAELPCRGVVYLWGLDVPPMAQMTPDRLDAAEALATGGALHLVRALTGARPSSHPAPRLWLVTRNAQAVGAAGPAVEALQAPLWGLGRTVAQEYPVLWGGLIDLAPAPRTPEQNADALAAELQAVGREREVALRDGGRFGARLVRAPARAGNRRPRFRPDATYLITGGLGTLGLRLARWLVEQQGVRSLVLVARRGPEGAARAAVEALRARGDVVDAIAADVAVEADVVRVLDEIRRRLPPLRGVVHCAGVLDDGILEQMDWTRFTRVTAPKVRGGWLLHRFTAELELDFFLLPSTLLSLTGGAGQANYAAANAFLDALGAHRRALGLPAMVVNWGPWADAGMATAAGPRGEAMWRARGTRLIPPDDAMRVLAQLVDRGIEHAAVTITDWATYLEPLPETPALYTALLFQDDTRPPPSSAREAADVRARLRSAPPGEHRGIVLELVRAEVMNELGFTEMIDTRQPLDELGVDSLMSVNVANRLERVLRIAVPLGKLVRGPSLEELVDDLVPDLAAAGLVARDAVAAPAAPIHARPPAGDEPAGSDWLVFPRPNAAARVRLFCFPYAGGGAAVFRPWAELLDPAVELVAIEPPGRGGRIEERALDRLEAFVERLVPAMTPYLDRPCVFFGHCLGALLLYETARRLLAEQRADLAHVFVSGARPPHRVASEGLFEETLLAHLLQHPEFDPLRSGPEQPDAVFAEMIRHFNIGATDDVLDNAGLRRLLLPTIRADFALASHYRFRPEPPWDVPLTCFVGHDDPYVNAQDALAWGKYTRLAFHLWMREGAHFLVVDDRAFIVDAINAHAALVSGGRHG